MTRWTISNGDRPVSDHTLIKVEFDNGTFKTDECYKFEWRKIMPSGGNIARWQLAKEEVIDSGVLHTVGIVGKHQWNKAKGVPPNAHHLRVDVEFEDGHTIENTHISDVNWYKESLNAVVKWRYCQTPPKHTVEFEEEAASVSEDTWESLIVPILTQVGKQDRYMIGDDKDKIDMWAEQHPHDIFRKIMFAMIDKYECRLGRKDDIVNETAKMLDYMNRWHNYELIWAKEDAEQQTTTTA